MARCARGYGRALLAWALWLLSAPAWAQAFAWERPDQRLPLTDRMQVMVEPGTGGLGAAQARDASPWQPATLANRKSYFKPATLWLRTTVTNASDHPVTRWVVLRPWRLAQVELFEFSGNDLRHQHFDAERPVPQRALQTVNPAFAVTLAPGQSRELLLRIQDSTIPLVTVEAWVPRVFAERQTHQLVKEGMVLATALALCVMLLVQLDWRLSLLGLALASTAVGELVYEGLLAVYLIDGMAGHYGAVFPFFAAMSFGLMGLVGLAFAGTGKPRWWSAVFASLFLLLLGGATVGLLSEDRSLARMTVGYLCLAVTLLYPVFLLWRPVIPPGSSRVTWFLMLAAWPLIAQRTGVALGLIPIQNPLQSAQLSLLGTLGLFVAISVSYALSKRRQEHRLKARVQAQEREYRQRLEGEVRERTAELSAAKVAAETADAAKSKFVGRISHDLRSPLTSILGYSQMLLSGGGPAAGPAKVIHHSGMHMLDLVNDLIESARGITDEQLDPRPIYVHSMVASITKEAQMLAMRRGNRLVCALDPQVPPVVVADRRRLRQVLLNLLDNAAKYTDGGEIRLAVSAHLQEPGSCQLCVEVSDEGCGIPASQLATIFEPFARAQTAAGKEGLGLGLSIVRSLVQRMGGSVTLSSTEGVGTCVRLELPLPIGSESEMTETDLLQLPSALPDLDGEGQFIMLVEDNEEIRKMLRISLVSVGFEVEELPDAPAVARRARAPQSRRPDLVITDDLMPDAQGDAVLATARERWPGVPVVLVSATQQASDGRFDASLMKPVHLGELFQVLGALLKPQRAAPAAASAPADGGHDALDAQALEEIRQMIEQGAMSDLLDYTDRLQATRPEAPSLVARIRQLAAEGNLDGLMRLNTTVH